MKTAFFELENHEKEFVRKGIKADLFSFHLTPNNASKFKNYESIAVFIHKKIDKNVLKKMKRLKLIATMSTGYDHIDLEECKKRNITVCYVAHYGENTVAEHAFALILNLTRKISQCIERVKSRSFSSIGLIGIDLNNKTIGIVGTGNIGKHMVRMAKGFNMNVIAYDLFPDKKLAKELKFNYTSFNELLKKSDIISLHVPYNKNTHHLINTKNIGKIKKGAILINTARGALIETKALIKALDSKIISAAGLDVLEEENFIGEEIKFIKSKMNKQDLKIILEDYSLLKRDNVIITPHNAFNTKEAVERILETTIFNIKSFMRGKKVNSIKF